MWPQGSGQAAESAVEITVTGLPFAGYYLFSTAAQQQLLGGTGRRTATEPLFPITLQEVVFLAVVVCGIVLWYRERQSISPVIGAGLIVIGPIWSFAVLLSGEYLSYFLPVLAVPLMLTGLVASVCATVNIPHVPRISWRFSIPVLVLISVGLTITLLDAVLPGYPF